MLGANLSDQIPRGPNLTLTLTLNSNWEFSGIKPDTDAMKALHIFGPKRQLTLTSKSKRALGGIKPDTDTDT